MSIVISNNAVLSPGKHVASLRSQNPMLNNNKSGGIVSMSGIRDNVTTELDVNSNEKNSEQKQSNVSLYNLGATTQSMHRIYT